MRWKQGPRSQNVEDRRGKRVPGGAKGVGLGAIVLALIMAFVTKDPSGLIKVLTQGGAAAIQGAGVGGGESNSEFDNDENAEFVRAVLGQTEEVWGEIFARGGQTYPKPGLVLFRNAVQSACGTQQSAVGPFYCPGDSKAYIDLSFFEDLKKRHNSPGDFAQAYVLAHEVGHHIQNVLGTSTKVHQARRRLSEAEGNDLSVRQELQADFFAGVWAHHAQKKWNILEEGDIEEALNAANAIGDDRLQKEARGYTSPDSFTHGTSEQRMRWFTRGLKSGDMNQGDTFSATNL